MSSGPPAIPSFAGTGIPGMAIGMLPTIIPMNMPMNIGTMLGIANSLFELPSSFFTSFRIFTSPMIFTVSPNSKVVFFVGRISMPERYILVMLASYLLYMPTCSIVLPAIFLFVTRTLMRSIVPVMFLRSLSTTSPSFRRRFSMQFCSETPYITSPSCITSSSLASR